MYYIKSTELMCVYSLLAISIGYSWLLLCMGNTIKIAVYLRLRMKWNRSTTGAKEEALDIVTHDTGLTHVLYTMAARPHMRRMLAFPLHRKAV